MTLTSFSVHFVLRCLQFGALKTLQQNELDLVWFSGHVLFRPLRRLNEILRFITAVNPYARRGSDAEAATAKIGNMENIKA